MATFKRKRTNNNGRKTKIFRRTGPTKFVIATRSGRMATSTTELKFHDLDINDAVIAQNGTIAQASCNIIAQGTTESERVGRKCTIRSINWRFQMQLDQDSTNSSSETIRVLLYLDKQTNGAAATALNILESDDFQSFNNLSNKGRFLTLMDRQYTLNKQAAAGNGTTNIFAETQVNDTFFKTVNIPIEFDNSANTGAIGTQRTNNIGLLILGQTGAIASFNSKMRLRFSDS